jgi:antibiotic biosynthesis monooxygenase (ABM) superfamily enzyme
MGQSGRFQASLSVIGNPRGCHMATRALRSGDMPMAVTIFVVRATITKDREAAFNKWYNAEHAPQVLQFNGAVSARRYKKILGEDKFQYMAIYEFASEATFKRFQASDHLKTLVNDYNASFGEVSDRERSAYVQIWP